MVYLYQRAAGVIIVKGKTVIPGWLDPLGMLLGYPHALTVTVGDPIAIDTPAASTSTDPAPGYS
jgi:hypothetical protein